MIGAFLCRTIGIFMPW